jgi:peptidoglycan/xylan/chitin deacetylase (PgdA/CDA1 family)
MGMHELLQKDPDIWDLFCRKEEYPPSLRDKYNRFPYYASQYRTIFEPKASEFLIKNGYHVEYPDEKPFAVCLTHDIDSVCKSFASKSFKAAKKFTRGKFIESIDSMKEIPRNKDPLVNFQEIMKLEDKYNACSSFYFLALDPADRDYAYQIEDLEEEIQTIQSWGWEVGLHGGHEGSRDLTKLKKEKRNLEKVTKTAITGCRNHYLNFVVPDTWESLRKAGFLYDCSLGYADCIGFRNGMCHPYKPFNLNTGKIIEIIEIPQVIMDVSLFDDYMRLDFEKAWAVTRQLINTVAECHGVITLLWHNHSLIGDKRNLYEKILQYCAEKEAWMTSGEHIATWWKANSED